MSNPPPRAGEILAVVPRPHELLQGVLVKRYKRFFADVELTDGTLVTAHCVNTGTMEGLTRPGTPVWLSRADNPKRKLQYTWELALIGEQILGVNTNLPNRMVHQLLLQRQLPWLAGWETVRPEKPYGEKSRVDFWLTADEGAREHYLEVKNCHLVYPDGCGYFPDCVSTRAAGHLEELAHCCARPGGHVSAEVLFFVQVNGAAQVRPSDLHDPAFGAAARRAHAEGVSFSSIGVEHTAEAMTIYGPIPVDLQPYDTAPLLPWREANRAPADQPI